jgi:hypothetical protein
MALFALTPSGRPRIGMYIYGLFADSGADVTSPARSDVRLLPVPLHTPPLCTLSTRYRLRHRWGP